MIPTRFKPSKNQRKRSPAPMNAAKSSTSQSEDLATVLVRFDGGARGAVCVGQVCAGHKNDLWFEVNGRHGIGAVASGAAERAVDWPARRPRTRCCRKIRRCCTAARSATRICPAAIRRRGPTRSATSCGISTDSSPAAGTPTKPSHPRSRRSTTAIAPPVSSMRFSKQHVGGVWTDVRYWTTVGCGDRRGRR